MNNWRVSDNDILYIEMKTGDLYFPNSKEIFLSEFKSIPPIKNSPTEKPSVDVDFLEFSKIPLSLEFVVTRQTEAENKSEYLQLFLQCKNNKENFIPDGMNIIEIDYIIYKNVWYPFEQGAIEEIRDLLKLANILSLGRISLKQYLILRNKAPHLLNDIALKNQKPFYFENIINSEDEIPFFKGKLYPYQFQGYRWLKMISEEDAGCILADEMGLGKTAQIIALLSNEKDHATIPSLVIAPVSLMENWRREIEKFAPEITTVVHQGNNRTGFFHELRKFDLVITTYDTVLRDLPMLQMLNWNLVVLDEAQAIKNPYAKRSKAVKQVPRRTSIAVTGTPIENRLTDLWSITDFAFPGYLGNLKDFEMTYTEDIDGAQNLESVISPIMLRRRVKEVAGDLPPKINIPQVLQMNDAEAGQYEMLRQRIIDEYGKNASLISLIKLRMFCSHPMLQMDEYIDPSQFMKYQRMLEIIEEITLNKEKAIIFTSFKRMSDIIVSDLTKRYGFFCDFIDGRVPVDERQLKIDAFSKEMGSAVLVLNPRAAGAGLNITAANHVIHYNLEWNPAVEDQASARSYRRGQERPVNIYRLFYANTVEEAIDLRLDRKRQLSDTAVIGNDGTSGDYEDILQALSMTPISEG
ncbi:hypothetical protein QW71_09720 [Paenibacillus sp. IHB B 3415]|uniref:DEAD/DEAH box helicase n=1 Tax=Paenibacillus sp. IHB B 3415 TaxID=867080 RepID=UPI0005756C84|nr:DEAD/DEAH box helicase [Paenibacillus sp. IHB B 3415]KHL95877.1 hypothetical protein QW71_09720 [Paenibacillus sp. IHB B 3415]